MRIFAENNTDFLPMEKSYISTKEYAEAHGLAERTIRNYCTQGKIPGAKRVGKTWSIPTDASLPQRKNARNQVSPLLKALLEQKEAKMKGGIYHRTQIELTYNSNHIEGSRLTEEQTRHIFEIDHAKEPLTESMVKQLHGILKNGTTDASRPWFAIGDYKRLPNEVGGIETTPPEKVGKVMRELLREYKSIKEVTLDDILDFHQRLETIHPFQDGNGRVGRLVMFKECLRHDIVPFIITDDLKMFYYRGLRQWPHIKGYLTDTCLTAQDHYKALLDYFKIKYS